MAYSRGIRLEDETSKTIIATAAQIARREGMEELTVKRVLTELKVSNRVFYNRFRNIDDVIQVLYEDLVQEIRSSLERVQQPAQSYPDYLLELAVAAVEKIYQNTLHFKQYLFSYQVANDTNRDWWLKKIQQLLRSGMEQGELKVNDPVKMSYGVWCFCLGFHRDAVGEELTEQEAMDAFREAFSCLIQGML